MVAKRLCNWTGSDAVFDPARVMRLPGFVNTKPAANGALCSIIRLDAYRRYALVDLVNAMDLVGAPPVANGQQGRSRRTSLAQQVSRSVPPQSSRLRAVGVGTQLTAIDINALDGDLQERLRSLEGRLSPEMQRVLRIGLIAGDSWRSRSEAEFGLCRALERLGAEDDDVIQLLLCYPRGIAARTFERGIDSLRWTIERVRDTPPPSGTPCSALVLAVRDLEKYFDRALLKLRVLDGPWAGASIPQGITLNRRLWPHLFRSAGLGVPPFGINALHELRGRIVRVELKEKDHLVQVAYWRQVPRHGNKGTGSLTLTWRRARVRGHVHPLCP